MDTNYPSPVKTWYTQNNTASLGALPASIVMALPVAFLAIVVLKPGGDSALTWLDDWILFAAAAGAAIACFFAAMRYRGSKTGLAWGLISLGMLLMAFGEFAWGFQETVLNSEVNSPAVADIGYLGFYPAVLLGLLLMPFAPVTGLRRAKLALDLGVAVGALGIISFHFVIESLINSSGENPLQDVITLAYPISDIALVLAALTMVARAGRGPAKLGFIMLAVGFGAIAFSDTLFAYVGEVSSYSSGAIFDLGWLIGYLLIAVAAMMAAGRRVNLDVSHEDTSRPLPFLQTTILHGLIIPAGVMLFLNPNPGTDTFNVDIVVLAGFVVIVAMALLRQMLTYFDHLRIYRQMEELTLTLKHRVQEQQLRNMTSAAERRDLR